MSQELDLKLVVRVEPGSLGPDGLDHVESFCMVAEKVFSKVEFANLTFKIVPRYDKKLPELELLMNRAPLPQQRAVLVLDKLNLTFELIEEEVMERISKLIDRFLGHKY
ncbi:hypothetical protein RT723_02010 [Psychrosphaera aquimarina]|uniref:Uncharacterized protein n=1 Tax=Psychrosphaera aquimarina TaxID=2044854 RepID=A0ABU3QWK0_9GAMM|nr:hypothetical protein [Psychrosphaera aquimarina]MDU0111802.1 hypothetical protein [Psychrosphaera aquimarina]